MKPPTAIIGDGVPIEIPAVCDPTEVAYCLCVQSSLRAGLTVACAVASQVDWEVELAVVIGETCRDVCAADALKYVRGYSVANDISARKWQGKKGGSQWCRSKSFDTFLPLGPRLVSAEEITDPNALRLSTTVNGEVVQGECNVLYFWHTFGPCGPAIAIEQRGRGRPTHAAESSTADMIFGVEQIIEFLSQGTTLLPGTLILTGTPEGVVRRPPPRFRCTKITVPACANDF